MRIELRQGHEALDDLVLVSELITARKGIDYGMQRQEMIPPERLGPTLLCFLTSVSHRVNTEGYGHQD